MRKGRIWILFACLVILILGMALMLSVTETKTSRFNPVYSTYYEDPTGLHKLYRLLGAAGYRIDRNYQDFGKFDIGTESSLIMMAPEDYVGMSEMDGLKDFINDGGSALFCVTRWDNFLMDFGIAVELTEQEDEELPEERDERYSGKGLITWPDPALKALDSIAYFDDGYEQDVMYYDSDINFAFRYHYQTDSLALQPLIAVDDEIYAAHATYGNGHLWIVSNPYIFTNEGLSRGDNYALAMWIFGQMHATNPGKMVFDEYHHGFKIDVVSTPMKTPEVRYMVWGLIATFLLAIWSFNKATARPVPVIQDDRRKVSEYVTSVASLHGRKGGDKFLFKAIVDRFFTDIRNTLGVSAFHPAEPEHVLKRAAGRWGNEASEELHNMLKLIAVYENRYDGEQALKIVRQIREFSKKYKLDRYGARKSRQIN